MGKDTAISWCHHTHNLWWGCEKISPGCAHCYAAELDKRLGGDNWRVGGPRRFFEAAHYNEPRKWHAKARKAGVHERVFVGSMMDFAERHVDAEVAARQETELTAYWEMVLATPYLDYLMLTKRTEDLSHALVWGERGAFSAPLRNVWLGATCEDQEHADKRIPQLEAVDAVLRFLSCEPLLGPLDLRAHLARGNVHWVIGGCESGRKKRPCEADWLRSLRDQCAEFGVPFFLKQAIPRDGQYIITDERPIPQVAARIGELIPVVALGKGSRPKRGGVIELPYLDGVQHAAVPESPAAVAA